MAGAVRTRCRPGTLPLLAGGAGLLACICWPLPAWPLGAAAPFTPPAALQARAAAPGAAAVVAPVPADAAASAAVAASLAGIKSGVAPQALIDGRWWSVGERVRGALLVAVSAQSVRLRHADGRIESLRLTPQVDWHRAARRPGAGERSDPLPPAAPDETSRP